MNEKLQKFIQNDPVLSLNDVKHYLNEFAETPEDGKLVEKALHALFQKAASKYSEKDDSNKNLMTPEAIFAKFRCDMYKRMMGYLDEGSEMSYEEMERWVDRATEFVMKK